MESSAMIFTLTVFALMAVIAKGQINRYINPTWLEMDANSEFYPGGQVISQILQAYGLGDGSYGAGSRYRSSVLDRNGYDRYYPRNRIVNSLNYAYDSDPLAQENLDRNYDYVDNTARSLNRYRDSLVDVVPTARRNRINVGAVPRTVYQQSDYADRDLSSLLPYSRSRLVDGNSATTQNLPMVSQTRGTARLVPRSTAAPTDEKRKNT